MSDRGIWIAALISAAVAAPGFAQTGFAQTGFGQTGEGSANENIITVSPGNRLVLAPDMPGPTFTRLLATRSSLDRKYKTIMDQLARNKKLLREASKAAALYDIDPIHIIGALVGEHTFNVGTVDSMQVYYIKATSYLKLDTRFEYDGEPVSRFVQRRQFAACADLDDSYRLWDCRERIWNKVFSGNTVDGAAYPGTEFDDTFFRPFYAGQTFELGQISPLAALKANDMAVRISGMPKLSADRPGDVYYAIMQPKTSLHYMAAIIRHSIDTYRDIAGMDISGNPGITATLYNLGRVERRALALREENMIRREAAEPLRMPTENYYGWPGQ